MSISDTSCEDSATIITRLVDDSGWIIAGGFETFGSACAWVSRSATTWRAWRRSVPGSNIRTIEERPGTDSESIVLEPRDAVQEVRLERDGDELLDFLGRQAERLGLDLDVRVARTPGARRSRSTAIGWSRRP